MQRRCLVVDRMSKLQELFERFNKSVSYCVFKEIDLIEKTAAGEEDIDILVDAKDMKKAKQIMLDLGYRECMWPKYLTGIKFYIGYDQELGGMSLLHIHTKLRIGTKRAKELRWKSLEREILTNCDVNPVYGCNVIKPEHEICLLFVRMILRKKPNKDDYARIEELIQIVDINEGAFADSVKQMIRKMGDINIPEYIHQNAFGSDAEREGIRKYLKKGIPNMLGANLRLLWCKVHFPMLWLRSKLRFPNKPIHRFGKVYAIIGVDGSGKTTLVDNIMSDFYMNLIGVKRIYGGNNEYAPWLQKAVENIDRYKGISRKIIGWMCIFDKRSRIFRALMICLTGKNVIFDRYYYDDLVGHYITMEKEQRFIRRVASKIIKGWIGIKPHKTFYLDISPEVAYSRKKDYSFEKLCANINMYRNVMFNRKEVVVVDATMPAEEVKKTIISYISQD